MQPKDTRRSSAVLAVGVAGFTDFAAGVSELRPRTSLSPVEENGVGVDMVPCQTKTCWSVDGYKQEAIPISADGPDSYTS